MSPTGPRTKNLPDWLTDPYRVVRQKNMVMGPMGSGTKNDCAGKGQQQITALPSAQDHETENLPLRKVWSWVQQGPKPRITVLVKASSKLPDHDHG
jgi:hypothetical protein